MFLTGKARVNGYDYFLQIHDVKAALALILFTPYHDDDAIAFEMQGELNHPLLSSEFMINKDLDDGYIVESVKRLKTSGKVYVYKQSSVSEIILNELQFATNYCFASKNILQSEDYYYLNNNTTKFKASDENLLFERDTENGLYTYVKINHNDFSMEVHPAKSYYATKNIDFVEVEGLVKKNILINTIKVIDYQMLCDTLDMSWYFDGVEYKKDYKTIKTIQEFESQVITPIVTLGIEAAKRGEKLDLTLDTETTGLNICDLSANNPDKDHCVAIPMSWAEDTGIVIFTDMEHFNNIPNEYAAKRLGEILTKFDGTRDIEIFVEDEQGQPELQNMDLFGDTDTSDISTKRYSKKTVQIQRDFFNLIGHNVMFDGKVMKDIGAPLYFDDDTLQMAFILNPTLVKGNRALKMLTRKLFNHETPELTDILGKGNEDKYRYLSVEEVAKIYGCADGDYTLKVFHKLKSIMSSRMYAYYKMQDVPMLNILYHSEYYGMTCIEELLEKEAEKSRGNLEILQNFIYEYVGAFVSVYKQRMILDKKLQASLISEDEYKTEVQNIKVEWGQPYIFELKAAEIRKVLYDILKYPILGWTVGKKKLPKTDKYVIGKLVKTKRDKNDTHYTRLDKDILKFGCDRAEFDMLMQSNDEKKRKKASKMILISKDDFNKSKYPLALALQKYAELNKEYTAYFAPMEQSNLEGKIFKGYSLARIETRRIMNPGQTMKGNLKALIRSYNDDYYLVDFDMSQVEYRIMLSLAGFMMMVERMSDPEKDYHTETASLINSIPAHKVDKKTRKRAKGVSFGVPYGLGLRSLCDNLFGVINDDTLMATRMLLSKWESANHPIMEFLNEQRDNALVARAMTDELRDFMDAWKKDEEGNYLLDENGNKIPRPTGFSYNHFGFYRTYDLSDIDFSPAAEQRRKNGNFNNEEGKIRRPAGNYPIQSFASELFRIILIRFYNRCVAEGISDKVIWHMLIHDELLCSVHKSIHPFFMYKIIKESCMITMKGHTQYFVGINIGKTWAETKDDEREAPVYFVNRMIKRWDNGEFGAGPFWFDDPWNDIIKDERAKYVSDRIYEVIHQVQPNIDNEPINIPHILEKFDNYTVRAYVEAYDTNYDVDASKFDMEEKVELEEYEDRVWVARFETWALEKFGSGKPIYDFDNRLIVLRDRSSEKIVEESTDDFDFVDFDELFDDDTGSSGDYWSFDEVEANEVYDSEYVFYNEEEEEEFYDLNMNNKVAKNLAQLINKKRTYENIQVFNDQAIITVANEQINDVKEFLKPYIARDGIAILLKTKFGMQRWVKVKTKTPFKDLDALISRMNLYKDDKNYEPVNFKKLNNQLLITVKDKTAVERLQQNLEEYKSSDGYALIVKTYLNKTYRLAYYKYVSLKELDQFIGTLK